MIDRIVKKINIAKTILIVSHKNPDGDTLGANFGLALSLIEKGKNVISYCDSSIPFEYRFLLKDRISFTNRIDTINEFFDVIIFVDCGDQYRTLFFDKIRNLSKCIINIDHHKTNSNFGDINLVKYDESSTGEIIFDLLIEGNLPVNKDIAECLYTAIITDTGSFRYSNTTEKTFITASNLMKYGINSWDISEKIYENKPLKRIFIMKEALNSLVISENKKVAIMVIKKELLKKYSATSEDTDGLVNIGRSIQGVEFSIFIREEDNGCKISFRSKGNLDVAGFAKEIGGGGHKNAAGAFIKEPLKVAENKIMEIIKKHGL